MTIRVFRPDRLLTLAVPLCIALLSGTATCQETTQDPAPAAEKTLPVFKDGQAQVVDGFRKQMVKQWLWVETTFDSDDDGKMDRVHVDVWRPRATETEGLKVPVVYETSPYFAGVDQAAPNWDPKQEVDSEPPKRKPAPGCKYGTKPGMISQSEVNTWVPRGFAVVHSSSPGTGFSEGCPTVGGDNEALAPKCVIDWLNGRAKGYTTPDGTEEVKAEWCTGKVGMTGTSYNGTLPIACATTGVQGLEAIIPISPNTSYYIYYRSNGLVRHPGGYMGEDIDVLYDFINSGNPERRDYCNKKVRDGELLGNFDRTTGDFNDFWAGRDYGQKLDKVHCALLMAHGWNDWNVMPEHAVRIYAAWKLKGLPHMAYFHQGGHGGPPPMELMNKWFTRFLYGVENDVEKEPKAWIVREKDKPSSPTPYADYPNPEAKPVMLHVAGDGLGVGSLQLTASAGQKPETLVDDVAVPGARLAMDEKSEHRLLFATLPLTEPLHLSGTAKLSIRLACDKPAANLSVWLVSLPWTERARHTDNIITRGWADPQNHASLRKGEPLVPGKFVEMTFNLEPDDQILAVGERIGLMIFSSDRDFTLWPPAGTKLTVDLAGTSLELPVVGGEAAFQKATAAAK
jgi:X-Pro dipeptidyl-peptidase